MNDSAVERSLPWSSAVLRLCEIRANARSEPHLRARSSKLGRLAGLPRSVRRPSFNHPVTQILNISTYAPKASSAHR